jgi:hypothetical protein
MGPNIQLRSNESVQPIAAMRLWLTLMLAEENEMPNSTKTPVGLIILSFLSIYSGIRPIWNLFYHSTPVIASLCEALFFLLMGVGLMLRYRIAFIAFVVFYGYQFVACIVGIIWPGPTTRVRFALFAAVKLAQLVWLFYYRSYFFKRKSIAPGQGFETAIDSGSQARP